MGQFCWHCHAIYVEIVFVPTCTVVYVTVPIAVRCNSFTLLLSLYPEQFSNIVVNQASCPREIGGTWGNPMATSTPTPGYFGNSTSGFGGGSGMTQIQQMVSERGSGGRGDEERGGEG